MPGPLEYAEEDEDDLFGDYETGEGMQINTATPIAGPSKLRIPVPIPPSALPPYIPSSPSMGLDPSSTDDPDTSSVALPILTTMAPGRNPILKPSVGLSKMRPRLAELRELRIPKPPERPAVGPMTLRQRCMAVLQANSTRIWDIGDVEYSVIKEFIDPLPAEQLAEIEEASPHIRKDTDWLWEYFLLTDYPLAHEACAERKGEKRTSGWRRMYKKAAEEATARQRNAAERVAQRYKEMDKARADKKIVVLNQVVQPKKARRPAGGAFGAQRLPSVTAKTNTLLGRAKADTQRARIAMSHAAGRTGSSLPRPPPVAMSTLAPASHSDRNGALASVSGPRIPAPRSKGTSSSSTPAVRQPPADLIPGSYPTSEYNARRAALPDCLVVPKPVTTAASPKRPDPPRQPQPPGFSHYIPPQPSQPRVAGLDFFGGNAALSAGMKRPRPLEQVGPDMDSRERVKEPRVGTGVEVGGGDGSAARVPRSISAPNPIAAKVAVDRSNLKNVLFRSKPKPKSKVGSQ